MVVVRLGQARLLVPLVRRTLAVAVAVAETTTVRVERVVLVLSLFDT